MNECFGLSENPEDLMRSALIFGWSARKEFEWYLNEGGHELDLDDRCRA